MHLLFDFKSKWTSRATKIYVCILTLHSEQVGAAGTKEHGVSVVELGRPREADHNAHSLWVTKTPDPLEMKIFPLMM